MAVNPDLRSGLYKQWGWINSESNRHWYANNASAEPARRQWYSSYFAGRIDSRGQFRPYHVYGYSQQGGVSTKFYVPEMRDYVSTFYFTSLVRPEKPAGVGMAVSWTSHVRRMRPRAGRMGFGLFSSGDKDDQIDVRMARLYEQMVKNGLPVGFVTSGHALKNWTGGNPLLLLDATDWSDAEQREIERLYQAGTPIVAFAGDRTDKTAEAFWKAGTSPQKTGSMTLHFKKNAQGTPWIYCPFKALYIPADALEGFLRLVGRQTRLGVESDVPMAVTPFISNGALFLAFGSLSDENAVRKVKVDPRAFDADLENPVFIDFDNGRRLPAKPDRRAIRRSGVGERGGTCTGDSGTRRRRRCCCAASSCPGKAGL